jgi:hypothetical protein
MTLVIILICCFVVLIIYQIFLAPTMEGFEEYSNDPLILGKQNAGNIKVLRDQIKGLMGVEKRVNNIEQQVKGLIDAQQQIGLDAMPN